MREMSVTEQRYKAVLAVIGDGRTVSEVCRDWGVSRRRLEKPAAPTSLCKFG
jgi:transposase-like protein